MHDEVETPIGDRGNPGRHARARGRGGSIPRVVVTSVLALAVSLPTSVRAAEPATAGTAAATPAEGGPPAAGDAGTATTVDLTEVKNVYNGGKAKYQTKDYDGAIADWTKALGMLPETEGNLEVRNDLVYNIATAQEKAFDIDQNVTRLRKAKSLLQDFLTTYKLLNDPDERTIAEFKRVNERIAQLDVRIAEAEKKQAPSLYGVENAEKKRRDAAMAQVLQSDPVLAKQYRSGRSMIIGGSISLGLGGLLLLGALAFVGSEEDRPLTISLAAVGAAAVVGGSVLLGVGVPRRRQAKEAAAARVVFTPTLVPRTARGAGFAGVGFVGRF
ncbi:MAG: hypothetical protein K1X88_04770 [Nannocystaceae bacterium]|nr:hypothetical protein [Nannocystaceae bacterium]